MSDGRAQSQASDVGSTEHDAIEELLIHTANRAAWETWQRQRRRRFRLAIILFILTFLSTTLVGADYWPLDIIYASFNPESAEKLLRHLNQIWPGEETFTLFDRFWQSIRQGCTYSVPLMAILLCHEMGHYLQAVRYRVPASFPYFIPLPLPPLGTMGAVILQGRGKADRRMMFDIAVSGPLAGLVLTIPILLYGIQTSGYVPPHPDQQFEFGQPLIVRWMITAVHGGPPDGYVFHWNGYATAGWVGVFITAINLLPIGQLDGGHIMYTLLRRKAHWIAWGLIFAAVYIMIRSNMFSYVLLLILLTLTGPRHPPTANDHVSLGSGRHILGWMTLAFLLIGFTLQPIVMQDRRPGVPEDVIEPVRPVAMESVQTAAMVVSSQY